MQLNLFLQYSQLYNFARISIELLRIKYIATHPNSNWVKNSLID